MKYLNNIDLSKSELQNAVVQVLATAPSSPAVGQLYFDSVVGAMRTFHGGGWHNRATDSLLLNGNNAAYYLNRANQTGNQTADTISDLASVVKAYRLDEFAVPTGPVAFGGQKITGVGTPTANGDVATYDFVLNQIQAGSSGISVKTPVHVVAQTNITLSGLQTIDGVTLVDGDRVLLVAQSNPIQNGVYIAAAGAWARATTEDATSELKGAFWLVNAGTLGTKTQWIVNNSTTPVVGTDAITIVQFGATTIYSASNGVLLSGSDFQAQVVALGGILTGASGLSVDTSIVARKFSADIGNGSSTSLVVTHNLGTRDVTLSIRDASNHEVYETNWFPNTTNQVTLTFTTAPATNSLRVTVIG